MPRQCSCCAWISPLSQPPHTLRQQPVEPLPVDGAHEHRVGLSPRHAPPVGDGHAEGELGSRLDLHVDVAAVEEGGFQKVGDHAGVVQGGAFGAVFGGVEAFEEIGPGGDGLAHGGAEGAHLLHPRPRGQGLVGDVQGHDHQRHAGFEHDFSGFGVDVDVELGRGGDVADLEIGAAHQDDLGHPGDDVGGALEGGGDVGERAEGAEGDGARGLAP